MLDEKGIKLNSDDRVSPSVDTPLTSGLAVRVWREGKQTTSVDEPINFDVQKIDDADQPIGYSSITTPGVVGSRSVTYEVTIQDGQEVSRTEIASIVITQPIQQVEVIGIKSNGNSLTKSVGVNFYTDSSNVTHRETYYDLDMSKVMSNCGQGGRYIVREDGVKVDAQNYIIVAANLSYYPRCSIVETSLGLGKVYDTGGFVTTYPNGFDIAADWSDYNGI
jgi:hypothetical protein